MLSNILGPLRADTNRPQLCNPLIHSLHFAYGLPFSAPLLPLSKCIAKQSVLDRMLVRLQSVKAPGCLRAPLIIMIALLHGMRPVGPRIIEQYLPHYEVP